MSDFSFFCKKLFSGLLMAFFSLLATFGNSCVIIAMIKEKRLRTISNLFILSLSISDLMIGVIVMPLSATIILYDNWLWGFWICKSWLTIDYIASTASIFNLFTLSLERFWSIVEPLKYISYKTKAKANTAIILVWAISALWFIPINFWRQLSSDPPTINATLPEWPSDNYSHTHTFECTTEFETNKFFKILTTFFNFYVPLLGMIMIYSKIFLCIKSRSESELLNTNNPRKINRSITCDANLASGDDYDPSSGMYAPRMSTVTVKHHSKGMLLQEPDDGKRKKKKSKRHYSHRNCRRNGLNQSHIISTLPEASNRSVKGSQKSSTRNSCKSSTVIVSSHLSGCSEYAKNTEKVDTVRNLLNGSPDSPKFSPGLKQQIKAAKQLGILLFAFLLFWMPYSIMFLVVGFCSNCISAEIQILCVWLGYINSAVNPILYPLCNSEFKIAFRKMFRISASEPTRRDLINILNYSKQ